MRFFHREQNHRCRYNQHSPLPKAGTALLTWNSKLCCHIWPSKWPLYQVSKQSLEMVVGGMLSKERRTQGRVNAANLCGPRCKWQGNIFISCFCLTVRKPRTQAVRYGFHMLLAHTVGPSRAWIHISPNYATFPRQCLSSKC